MGKQKQIKQIVEFLGAYTDETVEIGIEVWRTGKMPVINEGTVSDVPLAQNYNELTEEAKKYIDEESKKMIEIMPFCSCGKQFNLSGVCSGCEKGKEGYQSKLYCSCGKEEYFKITVQEKLNELSGGK